ncbi:MAG TPA: polysaccharide biosynthesis tyrosine autokinase [Thermoleophilaceae bacterium]|nr:polysaccharide biosynthesis tyrosine autokinase [Thermoleophilaceae bacterium]
MPSPDDISNEPVGIDSRRIRRQLLGLRRRLPLILACIVIVAGAATVYSLAQPKEYTAKAVLLFRNPGFDQSILGGDAFAPVQDATREAATNERLVALAVVGDRAARELGGKKLSGSDLSSKVEIASEGPSNLVGINATDGKPRQAARIANAFAREYVQFRRDADRDKVNQAKILSERQLQGMSPTELKGERARLLRQRLDQLETLASLQTGNAELVQPATPPTSPSAPTPLKNGVLAGFFGLLLGLALALLLERLDTRIRDTEDVEELLRRPVLGAIPKSRALSRTQLEADALSGPDAEAFRMLRASLRYFNVDHDIKSVLITSAEPGDGKSTVALHLAFAAADAGTRTLLIEADLRRPTLAKALRVPAAPGLTNVLTGSATLRSAMKTLRVPGRGERSSAPRALDVVLSGPIPPNPTDLLESERLRQVVREAEQEYDLVIIDTPPTSVVSDAIPLVSQTSGVIVVVRSDKTNRDGLRQLRDQLANLDARLLGVVLNSLGRDVESYAYAYTSSYSFEGMEGTNGRATTTNGNGSSETEHAAPDEGAQDAEAAPESRRRTPFGRRG